MCHCLSDMKVDKINEQLPTKITVAAHKIGSRKKKLFRDAKKNIGGRKKTLVAAKHCIGHNNDNKLGLSCAKLSLSWG